MKRLTPLLLLVLLTFNNIQAQNDSNSCSFEESREAYYKQNPDALLRAKQYEEIVKQKTILRNQDQNRAAETYVIPVVFHIYGNRWPDDINGNNREVTLERIQQSLASVNENFAGFNDAVDPIFNSVEGGMDVEFKLAQIDPLGNTTTGVIFHETKEGFGLNGTNDGEIAKYAWDNYKYFNVHIQLVLKSGSENNSGIAWFPDTGQSNEGVARVVYNGKYIIYSPPASSLTHEFGHFFGLHHTFNQGCVAGGDFGDLVEDTPPTIQGAGCETGITNCFGNYVNSQNHMDYNPCESMFTRGQVTRMESFMDHPSRVTLWQNTNHISTGINEDLGARVVFNYQDRNDSDLDKALTLVEGFNNDGSVINKRRIKAIEGAQFLSTGEWTEGVHFTTANVPNGLQVKINVIDNTSAEILLDGNASNHDENNSSNFTITLLDPAIVGGVNTIYSNTGNYRVNFIDDYEVYYENFSPSITKAFGVEENNTSYITDFSSFAIGANLKIRLKNYDGNTLVVDNPDASLEILCDSNSKHISYQTENNSINGSSSGTWVADVAPQTSPAILSTDQYTSWHGKTGYIGFRTPTVNGTYLYGWLLTRISHDGSLGEIISMGINPDPGSAINTIIEKPNLSYSTDRFLESVSNDGSMDNDIIVTLKNSSFTTTGDLVDGTDYTISNVPDGLQFKATVLNSQEAKLSMIGNATIPSADWDYEYTINFKFLDNVFPNNDASTILFKENKLNLEYLGESFSNTLNDHVLVVSEGNSAGTGSFSMLTSHESIDRGSHVYQMQIYTTGVAQGIKFISWRKDAVANDDYELTPLDEGTVIGPDSSWKNGREYYSGTGQHMIDSETYQEWRAKTKYIGVRIKRSGRIHYGWIKLRVSNGGNTFRFLEYGMSGTPDTPIKAGSLEAVDPTSPYCTASGQNGPEAISLVTIGDINSSSGRSQNGYEYFENITTALEVGSSNNLMVTITPYQDGSNDEIYAWFDWNQDGDFEDSNEYTQLSKSTGTIGQATIVVPQEAVLGITRMRLRVAYDSNANTPCGSSRYGEIEDYDVTIVPGNGNPTPVYCDASGQGGPEAITLVNFAGINNASNRNDSGYEDFTNENANVNTGSSYDIYVTITPYQDGSNDEIYAWFDWNQDGDFEGQGEFVQLNKTSGTTGQASITIPADAILGTTTMRLRVAYYANSNVSCGAMRYGEVEDYVITISGNNAVRTSLGGITKEIVDPSRINIYPNPMTGSILNINFNTIKSGAVNVAIYNTKGQEVFSLMESKDSETKMMIQLDKKLSAGLYFLKISLGDELTSTTKLMIR